MSLRTLPPDTLSLIISHLPPPSRRSLALTHPSLYAHVHPDNHSLWQELLHLRFSHRPSLPSSLLTRKPPYSPYHLVSLRDLADDYLIHSHLPWHEIAPQPHPTFPPLIHASRPNVLTIAAANCISTHTRLTSPTRWRPQSMYYLESPATALLQTSFPRSMYIGMANGAVHMPPNRTLRLHKSAVTSLSLLSSGVLISSSVDKTIRLTTPSSRRTHTTLRGHDSAILTKPLESHTFCSYSLSESRVKLWDASRACCIATARPGNIVDVAVHNANIYTATQRCVHVLDARQGLATVAVLSLPRYWQSMSIGKLHVSSDGTLAACVGGGGVALWEARGGWDASPLGWARRWEGRPSKGLRALMVTERAVVAGGGARELLTFARNGRYEGLMMEGGRGGSVVDIIKVAGGLAVARDCGAVQIADCEGATIDWEKVQRVWAGETGRGFWDKTERAKDG